MVSLHYVAESGKVTRVFPLGQISASTQPSKSKSSISLATATSSASGPKTVWVFSGVTSMGIFCQAMVDRTALKTILISNVAAFAPFSPASVLEQRCCLRA